MSVPLTDAEKQQVQQVLSALLAGATEMGVSMFTALMLLQRVRENKASIIDIALESEVVGAELEKAIEKHGQRYSDRLLDRFSRAIERAKDAKLKKVPSTVHGHGHPR